MQIHIAVCGKDCVVFIRAGVGGLIGKIGDMHATGAGLERLNHRDQSDVCEVTSIKTIVYNA